jgi:hypothetical protein
MGTESGTKDGLEALKWINGGTNDEEIQTIMDMGFSREQADEALQVRTSCGGDVMCRQTLLMDDMYPIAI